MPIKCEICGLGKFVYLDGYRRVTTDGGYLKERLKNKTDRDLVTCDTFKCPALYILDFKTLELELLTTNFIKEFHGLTSPCRVIKYRKLKNDLKSYIL